MIRLETDQLQTMVNMLQQASNDIDVAAEQLMSITTHNGWACKERHTINSNVLENRTKIRMIQSQSSSFCNAVRVACDEFITTESTISQMFTGVEAMISAVLANSIVSVKQNAINISPSIESLLCITDSQNNWIKKIVVDIRQTISFMTPHHMSSIQIVKLDSIDIE